MGDPDFEGQKPAGAESFHSGQGRPYSHKKPFKQVFQFEVALHQIEPLIWRRIQVPETYSFWDLHCAITDSFGWLDYHLHQFTVRSPKTGEISIIGIPDEDGMDELETLPGWYEFIAWYLSMENRACDYEYDFGDGWHHSVVLEAILPREKGVVYPRCIGGERACPPEDVGGPLGYPGFLKCISYQNAEEHEETLRWVGGWFDPDWFDQEVIRFGNPDLRWKVAFQDLPIPDWFRQVQYHQLRALGEKAQPSHRNEEGNYERRG